MVTINNKTYSQGWQSHGNTSCCWAVHGLWWGKIWGTVFYRPELFDYFDYRRWGEVFWFTYYLDNMRYSIDYHWSVMSHLPPLTMNNGNKVIFEGLWSRHTHPKDFPRSSLMSIYLKFLLSPFLISHFQLISQRWVANTVLPHDRRQP